jgi:hypothetical protein
MMNLIFWIFIFVLGCSFFGISIQAIIESPAGQANFGYLLHLLTLLWQWSVVHLAALAATFRI